MLVQDAATKRGLSNFFNEFMGYGSNRGQVRVMSYQRRGGYSVHNVQQG